MSRSPLDPAAPAIRHGWSGPPEVKNGSVTFHAARDGAGVVYAYVWDDKILGQQKVPVGPGTHAVTVPGSSGTLAVAFEATAGGTASIASSLG